MASTLVYLLEITLVLLVIQTPVESQLIPNYGCLFATLCGNPGSAGIALCNQLCITSQYPAGGTCTQNLGLDGATCTCFGSGNPAMADQVIGDACASFCRIACTTCNFLGNSCTPTNNPKGNICKCCETVLC